MENIIFFIIGISLIFIFGKILLVPMKRIMKLIGNGMVGGITLVLFNIIGKYFSLYINVTPLNSIIAGFLGVPGVVLILILENFF